jgi:hypothetical protein
MVPGRLRTTGRPGEQCESATRGSGRPIEIGRPLEGRLGSSTFPIRAWLEPVGLWLGVKVNPETGGDRLVLIDPSNNDEIGDYTTVDLALRG